MALDTFVARANVGTGTDGIAGKNTVAGFVGAVQLTDEVGVQIDAANPLDVSVAQLPLPTGAATESTLALVAADIGDTTDAEATGNGSAIAILKRIRTLLGGVGSLETPAAPLSSYNQTGVITINTVLLTLDCSQHRSVSIQCVSMGTTGVVTPEWSNDNATWVAATLQTAAGATAATFNAAGLWVAPVMARYLRLRLSTATTAGTTTLIVHRFNDRAQMWQATQPVSGTVTATVSGAGITGGTISPLTVAGASALASAARTTTATSGALTNANGRNAHFLLNVSAVSGTTPNLAVRIQIQDPVSSAFIDLPGAAFTAVTTTGLSLLTVTNLPRTYQIAWTITGTTPSFTFSVGIAPVI